MSNQTTSFPSKKPNSLKESKVETKTQTIVSDLESVLSAKGILVPAVVVGAFGYFLGWHFLYAYYVGFGLDPAFFSFTPTEVIFAGWRMYVLIIFLIIFASFLFEVGQRFILYLINKRGTKIIVRIFFVIYSLGIGSVTYVVWQFVFDFTARSNAIFYILAFSSLFLFWLAFIFGRHLISSQVTKPILFKLIFPNPQLWLALIGLGTMITLAFFSGWTGSMSANRDWGSATRLQIVELYVNKELDIPNGQNVRSEVWHYDDLRFVFKTDDTFFVFRLEEVSDGIVNLYGIPQEYILEFHLRSWYDKIVHP